MDTDYQVIGKRLQDARENHGLTLEDISSSTKIQVRYLQAIETGQIGKLPGPFYVKAFIRQYANTVSLDPNTILDNPENASNDSSAATDEYSQRQPSDPDSLFSGEMHANSDWQDDRQNNESENKNLSKNSVRVGADRIPRAGMNLTMPMSRRFWNKFRVFAWIIGLVVLAFGLWVIIGKVHPSSVSQSQVSSSSTKVAKSKKSAAEKKSTSSSSSSSSSADTQPLSTPQFQSNTSTMTFYDTADHTIQIEASNASWTTINVDGTLQFSSTIPAGGEQDTTLTKDQQQVTIHIGNPYNTKILFDGKDTQFMSGSSVQITNIIIKREKTAQ